MSRKKSIHPLDGGYSGYLVTLDRVREYIETGRPNAREDVKKWYVRTLSTPKSTTDAYIDSLFRCGLLIEKVEEVACAFPKKRNKALRIVEIIDANIVFFIDMLFEARDGANAATLHSVGKRKYGLSAKSNVNQIWWRRGWLESAGMLEERRGLLWPTAAGERLLANLRSDVSSSHGKDEARSQREGVWRRWGRAEAQETEELCV